MAELSSDVFWWNQPENKAHEQAFSTARAIELNQGNIHDQNLRYAKLYACYDMVNLDWTLTNGAPNSQRTYHGSYSDNVVQIGVNTAVSTIGRMMPKAAVMTEGAVWSIQRKARMLDKFLFGIFNDVHLWGKGRELVRHAGIFGTSALKFYWDDGIQCEAVLSDELLVDERQCMCGYLPREAHQRKLVDKEVLRAMIHRIHGTKRARELNIALDTSLTSSYLPHRVHSPDQAVVIESWHLPSGPGAGDGRHTICIENATIWDEKWDKDYFPFVIYHWEPPVTGFYGRGIAELLAGKQLLINRMHRHIEKSQRLISSPLIVIDPSNGPIPDLVTNEVGRVMVSRGEPKFLMPTAVHPEYYNWLERQKQSALEEIGFSNFTASSAIPAGVRFDSSKALESFNQKEQGRHFDQSERYERFFLECAELILKIAKEHGTGMKTVFHSGDLMQTIPWKDVDMGRDKFVLTIQASSASSMTPAARTQHVMELFANQLISPTEARRLIRLPDVGRSEQLAVADHEYAERTLEKLLNGEWVQPVPLENLGLGLEIMKRGYLKAVADGAMEDEEGLEALNLITEWIAVVEDMMNPPAPPVPPEAVAAAQAGAPEAEIEQQLAAPVPGV